MHLAGGNYKEPGEGNILALVTVQLELFSFLKPII